MGVAAGQPDYDHSQVIERAAVAIEQGGRRPFARSVAATLLLTPDELMVVGRRNTQPEVFIRQDRRELAMVRRPTARGGERVELEATDGQHATLRFARSDAGAAQMLAGWLAGFGVGRL